jgi:hypothetical protein
VRWSKSNPLTSWMLLALLCMIALVLILPDVDLPDTAFRSNSSPLAIRTLSHQVPQANAYAGLFRVSLQLVCSSTLHCPVGETRARHTVSLPIEHKALRC